MKKTTILKHNIKNIRKLMKEFLLIYFFLVLTFFCNIKVKAADLKVIDGDTIIVDNEKIRFSGIDAPELKQTCDQSGQLVFCGILAKEVLAKRIGNQIISSMKMILKIISLKTAWNSFGYC